MAVTAKKRKKIVYLNSFDDFPYQREKNLQKSRRIFVNRNLKMKSVRMLGLDMDHTLAIYNKAAIEILAFEHTKRKMVEEKNYPAEILDLQYDIEFVIRGLVVDKVHGNIVKLDKHQYIGTVYHGKEPLSRAQRKELYTNTRPDLATSRYYSLDNLFAIPEVALYAEMITRYEDDGKVLGRSFVELFDDIRASIDKTHRDGSLKKEILADPGKYFQTDPNMPPALDKLIRSGKVLFLLTNSRLDYTEAVMSHILNDQLEGYPDWKDYFEYIIVDSGKPEFFKKGTPLKAVINKDYTRREHRLGTKRAKVYERGNYAQFENVAGFKGEEILYVGDHTYGDILRSKKSACWRTAMVIEELEHEVQVSERVGGFREELDKLYELRNELRFQANLASEKIDQLRETKLQDYEKRNSEELLDLDRRIREITDKLTRLEDRLTQNLIKIKDCELRAEQAYNRYWGPMFKAGKENSRFGDQVEDYACIYTSRASNFLYYPANKYFQTTREQMAHEQE